MTDMTSSTNEQAQELDDLDVEGHGLKEVALGLSAATIVAGGAGAASLALDNPLPGTTSGISTAVAGVHGDIDDTLTRTQGVSSQTLVTAGAAVDDVQRLADRTGSFAISTTTPVADRAISVATGAVGDVTDLAGDVVSDPIGTTDRVVDAAITTARDTRDNALKTVSSTATTAVDTADRAAATATETAGEATSLATSTATQVHTTLDPSVGIQQNEAGGTSVSVEAAGTTVTVDTR